MVFFTPGPDSYGLCKLLELQMLRYLVVLSLNVISTALYPAAILTNITASGFVRISKDAFDPAGRTAVWLATEQAKFMNGRYLSVNWAVDELMQRQQQIIEDDLLTVELKGSFGE